MEGKKILVVEDDINICQVVKIALEKEGYHAGDKNIRVDMEIENPELSLTGDANRLHQMFTNLLRNAIEHTPPDETVSMRAFSRKGTVIVEVTDKGPGIPADEQPYIWERFYKIDRSRRRDSSGAGLGLSITRQLAEMHGGLIEVENNPDGRGSTFRIKFS